MEAADPKAQAGSHIKTAGGLLIALGVLTAIAAVFVWAMMDVAQTAIEEETHGDEERIAKTAVRAAMGTTSVILLAAGILGLFGGVGMIQGAAWGRTVGYIAAGFQLINIPFGTAVGIYAFWAMGRPEADAWFQ